MAYILENQKWWLRSAHGATELGKLTEGQDLPFYVYDLEEALERADFLISSGLSIHYAMKANSHPRLLREFARRKMGVDVVSVGEFKKALAHGFDASRVIFSGVAKDKSDFEFALDQGIFQINCESFEELQLLEEVARARGVVAHVALRLNILLSAPTHSHVQTAMPDSKFGLDIEQLVQVLAWLKGRSHLSLKAIATHIGSQITDLEVFERMAQQMGRLYRELKADGFPLERLDLGGGFGIDYRSGGETDLAGLQTYASALKRSHGTDARVLIEPGRCVVARMGALLARVVYVKTTTRQKFVILNAGMNCLMRPALYQSYHRIVALRERAERESYTVVGPICESTDKFAVDREMSRVERGDWVAIMDAGAYGAVMANTYNESPLPQEWIWINGQVEKI